MAKKKVEEVVEEPVTEETPVAEPEVAPDEPEPTEDVVLEPEEVVVPEPPSDLVKVKANQNFRDGAFKQDFAAHGYTKPQWNEGGVRLLPARLYYKLQQRSGNKFSIVGGQ